MLYASPQAATALSKLIPALADSNIDADLLAWLADFNLSHNLLEGGLPNAIIAKDEVVKALQQMQIARDRLLRALDNEERKSRNLISTYP